MKKLATKSINGREVFIGTVSSYATTSDSKTVYRLLRLNSLDPLQEGDLFCFSFREGKWLLLPNLGYINPQSPDQLISLYMEMKKEPIEINVFIDMLFDSYYKEHYLQAKVPDAYSKGSPKSWVDLSFASRFFYNSGKRLKLLLLTFFKKLPTCP